MKLILSAIDADLSSAWRRFCGDLDFVELHSGSILDVDCDAAVSPANSFGFMDGGIDAVYRRHFGDKIEERVRRAIVDWHHGELLVGAAELVETGNDRIRYLVIAPTMRVPTILKDTVNPYLAARAALLLVKKGNFRFGATTERPISEKVERIAFPGLGTGVGQVSPNVCARQMRAAIDEVVLGRNSSPRTWAEASERHQLLFSDTPRRLQNP